MQDNSNHQPKSAGPIEHISSIVNCHTPTHLGYLRVSVEAPIKKIKTSLKIIKKSRKSDMTKGVQNKKYSHFLSNRLCCSWASSLVKGLDFQENEPRPNKIKVH